MARASLLAGQVSAQIKEALAVDSIDSDLLGDVQVSLDVETFRYLSLDWFTELSPVALDRKSASYEEESYYADTSGPTFSEQRAANYNVGKG